MNQWKIFAIDPGPMVSGVVVVCHGEITEHGIINNHDLLEKLRDYRGQDYAMAIEKIASYGMTVGAEVFETVFWTGRFAQVWEDDETVLRIPRLDIKLHLCHSTRAKDANIRQALLDKWGAQGTKKNPGPTYGIKSHAWAALAVATYVMEK